MTTLADDMQLSLVPSSAESLSARLGEPAWALEGRRAGLAGWDHLPFPRITDESWRRTDPERFRPEDRTLVAGAPAFDSLGDGATDGLVALGLDRALASHEALVRPHLHAVASPGRDKFVALNAAYRGGGAFVHVPDGRVVASPARVSHRVALPEGPAAFMPHSVVVAGRNSQATVVESFESPDGDLLAAPVVEVHLKEGARLQYVMVVRWGQGARAVGHFHAHLEKDAQLRVLVVEIGGSVSKTFMTGDLDGPGARSEMLGLVFASGRQHFDADTLHNHLVPNTTSDVLFNVALNDRSRSVFAGNIYVAPGAQKTDAYQKNRNLLLSDKARADSMPRLEIVANDVRCTHGATFTTYDTDQRFYLQSRGLRDADARRLIITGFFQEVIERLEGQALVDWLAELMQSKMEATLEKA